jgi:hypothetical protein
MKATAVYEYPWNVGINEPRHQGFGKKSSLRNNNDSTFGRKEMQKLIPEAGLSLLVTENN